MKKAVQVSPAADPAVPSLRTGAERFAPPAGSGSTSPCGGAVGGGDGDGIMRQKQKMLAARLKPLDLVGCGGALGDGQRKGLWGCRRRSPATGELLLRAWLRCLLTASPGCR